MTTSIFQNKTINTDIVPIYNHDGKRLDEIKLPEKIIPAISRRGGYGKSGLYYKGCGTLYYGHLVNNPSSKYTIIKKNNSVYQKFTVIYPDLAGMFGIFTFKHQPVFSDMEGACGPKEEKLLVNQHVFEYSAIKEIVDVIDVPIAGHKIYAYRLKDLASKNTDAVNLIEYVLKNDFNTAWDKDMWSDIIGYCYVRDLADWFVSDKFCHKIGTVYSMLNALFYSDKYLYSTIVNNLIGYQHVDHAYLPIICALVVEKYCPGITDKEGIHLEAPTAEVLEKLLVQLYSGKACCHLENESKWEFTKKDFMKQIPSQIAFFNRVNELKSSPAM